MLNKISLIGQLGKDPESKFYPNGDQQTTFSLATSERWKDKSSGERKEKVSWHSIVTNRGLAKVAGDYLKKGSKVYIGGKIDYQEWEKDGVKHYRTRIIADELHMLDGKIQSDQSERPQSQPSSNASQSDADFDEDLPF